MGTFIENSLIPGEQVDTEAEISVMSQLGLFALAVLLCWTVILPIVFIVMAIINIKTSELAVTNKKVIGKTGFIRRDSIDIPLHKVESLNVDQDILGRLFDFGRITIHGVGGNIVAIPLIKSPFEFRKAVMASMDQNGQM